MAQNPNQVYSFPRLLTIQHCRGFAESYSRSLLLEKHGFPLCNPAIIDQQGSVYAEKGVSIGDVGFISPGAHSDSFSTYSIPPMTQSTQVVRPQSSNPLNRHWMTRR